MLVFACRVFDNTLSKTGSGKLLDFVQTFYMYKVVDNGYKRRLYFIHEIQYQFMMSVVERVNSFYDSIVERAQFLEPSIVMETSMGEEDGSVLLITGQYGDTAIIKDRNSKVSASVLSGYDKIPFATEQNRKSFNLSHTCYNVNTVAEYLVRRHKFQGENRFSEVFGRSLYSALRQHAKASGRMAKKKHKIEPLAFVMAVEKSKKKDFICPICGKIVDHGRVVLKNGDRHYSLDDDYSPSSDRIDNDGHYTVGNVRITHRICNKRRGDRDSSFTRDIESWNPSEEEIRIIYENNVAIMNNGGVVHRIPIIDFDSEELKKQTDKQMNTQMINDIDRQKQLLLRIGELIVGELEVKLNKQEIMRLPMKTKKVKLQSDATSKKLLDLLKKVVTPKQKNSFSLSQASLKVAESLGLQQMSCYKMMQRAALQEGSPLKNNGGRNNWSLKS